ncbi:MULTISPECIES: DUF4232 domain-containing protein [Protofrankia]|uniref:DUF4232 domain-containing protein n=1 Tax=Protofrankia coriariae TaxID=1562887 RepID=A0ABR5F8K3_9ACTN|nr:MULTISPECIES: DUF4232 domain-containing protein [Protofrankia]KLL13058.1 hypothetical protein FrCorBMG51_00550 [Protofrankia coriariae]ONH38037.1 hypothetical protein BL254_00920 [Protofrankia sp. BMG5.30]
MKLVLGETGRGGTHKTYSANDGGRAHEGDEAVGSGGAGRAVARALTVLALAAACAACAGADGTGPGATGVSPSSPPRAGGAASTDTPVPGATGPGTGGTGVGVVPGRCAAADLQLSTAPPPGGSGMGHQGLVIVFTNRTRDACALTGYPGVAARDATGQDTADAARSTVGSIFPVTEQRRVVLEPNGSASAGVEWTVVPSGNQTTCPSYAGLRVTPPGDTDSLELPQSVTFCGNFRVHPVVPGAAAGT